MKTEICRNIEIIQTTDRDDSKRVSICLWFELGNAAPRRSDTQRTGVPAIIQLRAEECIWMAEDLDLEHSL